MEKTVAVEGEKRNYVIKLCDLKGLFEWVVFEDVIVYLDDNYICEREETNGG
jgi:hypothetical protein